MKTLFALLLLTLIPAGLSAGRHTALRDSILANIHGAAVTGPVTDVTRLGARGDGRTDCLKAFSKAIARTARAGGGTVSVPAGTYLLRGPLHLISNLRLDIAEGATLVFDPDPELYPVVNTSWEGTPLYNYSPMIYGYGLENVAITGAGTIDGNAMTTFARWRDLQLADRDLSRQMNHDGVPVEQRRFGPGHYLRPQLIQLYRCTGITIEGVRIINSPFWCVHLLECRDAICRSLRYDAKLINNDGIDPESSSDILIENIDFDNGDDNIAIKAGRDCDGRRQASPCRNIVIRGCRFKGLHAVVIGSEMSGGVSNVVIEDCTYAGYCKRGIYVKTNPDRGGYVRGLYVSDCTFDEVEDLFYVTTRFAGEGLDNTFYSAISGIRVDGLTCRRAHGAAIVLQGHPSLPLSDVRLDNITVGEARTGISFSDAPDVVMGTCHIGPAAGTPTMISPADRIFDR